MTETAIAAEETAGEREYARAIRAVKLLFLAAILFYAMMLRMEHNSTAAVCGDGTDSATYHYAAVNINRYGFITWDRDGAIARGEAPAKAVPGLAVGYPLFLAALYRVFPASYATVFGANVALSVLSLFLIWRILRVLGVNDWVSLFVVLLGAVYPPFTYMVSTALTENLYIPLVLGGVLCTVKHLRTGRAWPLFPGCALFAYASLVRGQTVAVFALCAAVCIWSAEDKVRAALVQAGCAAGALLLVYTPVELWMLRTTGQMFFFENALSGPRVWGEMPYFIDMAWSEGKTLEEITSANFAADPAVYIKWKTFGFFQRMWYDQWDENLVHPYPELRPFLLLHPFVIIPTVASVPLVCRRYGPSECLLALIPATVTLSCLFAHGLPRYVIIAVPCALILLGAHVDMLLRTSADKPPLVGTKARRVYRAGYAAFAAMLVFSVYIFSFALPYEQSEYRLSKYMDVSVADLREAKPDIVYEFTSNAVGTAVTVESAQRVGEKTFQGAEHSPTLIHASVPPLSAVKRRNNVVTRVTIDIPGGYVFDMMTVYWQGTQTSGFSDNKVYSLPRSGWSERPITVYIDDDVTNLMICPDQFRGGRITFNAIKVEKFTVEYKAA